MCVSVCVMMCCSFRVYEGRGVVLLFFFALCWTKEGCEVVESRLERVVGYVCMVWDGMVWWVGWTDVGSLWAQLAG